MPHYTHQKSTKVKVYYMLQVGTKADTINNVVRTLSKSHGANGDR